VSSTLYAYNEAGTRIYRLPLNSCVPDLNSGGYNYPSGGQEPWRGERKPKDKGEYMKVDIVGLNHSFVAVDIPKGQTEQTHGGYALIPENPSFDPNILFSESGDESDAGCEPSIDGKSQSGDNTPFPACLPPQCGIDLSIFDELKDITEELTQSSLDEAYAEETLAKACGGTVSPNDLRKANEILKKSRKQKERNKTLLTRLEDLMTQLARFAEECPGYIEGFLLGELEAKGITLGMTNDDSGVIDSDDDGKTFGLHFTLSLEGAGGNFAEVEFDFIGWTEVGGSTRQDELAAVTRIGEKTSNGTKFVEFGIHYVGDASGDVIQDWWHKQTQGWFGGRRAGEGLQVNYVPNSQFAISVGTGGSKIYDSHTIQWSLTIGSDGIVEGEVLLELPLWEGDDWSLSSYIGVNAATRRRADLGYDETITSGGVRVCSGRWQAHIGVIDGVQGQRETEVGLGYTIRF
jgi:hypothetical protein